MHVLEQFYPDYRAESAYVIGYEDWYQKGKRGILFDIDNTLVPHGAPADERSKELFNHLRKLGFRTMLLSNNKEPRVKSFAGEVQSDYLYDAGKPGVKAYREAMERLHTDKNTTLFVGDQLFTDIWGARRCEIPTILVQPIHPKEEIQIVLKRKLERIVIHFYEKDHIGKE
jgi:HAD superfamily phosphatase (TIGR01668 family)